MDLFPTDLMAAAAAGGPARGRKKKVLDHDDVSFGYWWDFKQKNTFMKKNHKYI